MMIKIPGRSRIHRILLISLFFMACQKSTSSIEVLKTFNADDMEGLLTRTGVVIDTIVSAEGKGALKIVADRPVVVKLFEVRNINVDNARLIYRAKLRSENVAGKAYLEMLCNFPGMGEFFSRSLQNSVGGSTNWKVIETPFFLQKGQNPDLVRMNIVIEGKGIVWIDDITLSKAPL